MADYSATVTTAHRLLEQFGEESTLVRVTNAAPPDPAKPWAPGAAAETNYQVHTVWISESILRRETLVKQGEVVAILAAKDLAIVPDPSTDHIKRTDGRRYAIVRVEPLDPAGTAIIYEIVARS